MSRPTYQKHKSEERIYKGVIWQTLQAEVTYSGLIKIAVVKQQVGARLLAEGGLQVDFRYWALTP